MNSQKPIVVTALVPNLLRTTPGQRAAIEAWEPFLRTDGIHVNFLEFETPELRQVLYTYGNSLAKSTRILSAYWRRLTQLPEVRHADLVYVYREASLIGPGLIERLLAAMKKPYVYSLDDPIFVPTRSPYQGGFSWLKFPGKVRNIVRGARAVLANSHPIVAWSRQYSENVHVIPSAVDTRKVSPRLTRSDRPPVVGWSGSGTTAANLAPIGNALLQIQQSTGAQIHLMGGFDYPLPANLDWQEIAWSADSEASTVAEFDIGIAPMPDNRWNHWKFSGKITYYMALGIPTVATAIGDIPSQLRHGVDGYLAESSSDWSHYLELLCTSQSLREQIGVQAREEVCRRFDVEPISRQVSIILRKAIGR